MSKLLSFVRGIFAPVAFLLIAAGLVLVYGPRVGIVRPWNIVVAVVLVLLAVAIFVLWRIVERRKERGFESAVLAQSSDDMARASVTKRGEIEALQARWKESLKLFRAQHVRGSGVLNRLPWFVILGESGSGKTTLLRNSGLDFPIGDAKIRGIGGTKNCDWWFANEAIILDTAGRYAFEVQSAPDREEWERFLTLLRRARGRKPINGLILTVPVDSLLQKSEDEVRSYAQHLRGKVNDLMTRLGAIFPIYLVATKVDLVEGFVDFFDRYPPERIREAVGRTFADLRPRHCTEASGRTLDDLYDRLCSMSLGLTEEAELGEGARAYLTFPEEFRVTARRMKVFIEALFRENIYMRNPVFRGLYLTSGTQIGRTISSAFEDMARGLGLGDDVTTTLFEEERPKRAYFVRDLMGRILIEDAKRSLVRPLAMGARAELSAALGKVIAPATIVAGALVLWSFLSWGASRSAWTDVASWVRSSPTLNATGTIEPVAAIADLRDGIERYRRAAERSRLAGIFLTRADPMPERFQNAYNSAVEEKLLVPTFGRLRSTLHGEPSSVADFVRSLAAYLAYREGIVRGEVEDPERLGPLVGVWRDETLAAEGESAEAFGEVVSAYVGYGGRETGGLDFGRIAASTDRLLARLDEADPLRSLARLSASVATMPTDSATLAGRVAELRDLAGAAGSGDDLGEEVFARIAEDLRQVPGAADALDGPLGKLRSRLSSGRGESAGAAAFRETVGGPLADLVGLPAPGLPTPSPPTPDSAKAVADALTAYRGDFQSKAQPFLDAVAAIEGSEVDGPAVAAVVLAARMTEAVRTSTAAWFAADGPLASSGLVEAAGGGGSTGGGPTAYVEPPGGGLFQCLYPLPSAAGSGAPPMAGAVLQGGGAVVSAIQSIPEVATDAKAELASNWNAEAVVLRPTGGGWNARAAVDRIQLADPVRGTTLEALPQKLRSGANLDRIVGSIRQNDAARAVDGKLRSFKSANYVAALASIADGIDRAEDSGGLAWVDLAANLAGGRRSDYAKAREAAESAPTADLGGDMVEVLDVARDAVFQRASAELAGYWSREVVRPAKALESCFPFRGDAAVDCDPDSFERIYGRDGAVGRLAPLVAESRTAGALGIGPSAVSFLQGARPIWQAYAVDGGGAGFPVVVEFREPAISPSGDTKPENLIVAVERVTLDLGGAPASWAAGGGSGDQLSVPVKTGAGSGIKIDLVPTADPSLAKKALKMFGSGYVKAEDVTPEPPRVNPGPWSFLRLLWQAKRSGDVFVFDVPILDTKRAEKHRDDAEVASVAVRFRAEATRPAPPFLDPSLWRVPPAPGSVED